MICWLATIDIIYIDDQSNTQFVKHKKKIIADKHLYLCFIYSN